jgi:hypothetical protein
VFGDDARAELLRGALKQMGWVLEEVNPIEWLATTADSQTQSLVGRLSPGYLFPIIFEDRAAEDETNRRRDRCTAAF